MADLPHTIRETLPEEALHRAGVVAAEMRAFAEQHAGIMSQTFGGGYDHEITVSGSRAAMGAIAQMVGNVTEPARHITANFGLRGAGIPR